MKIIASILIVLFCFVVVCLLCAGAMAAEPLPANTFLQAITLDVHDGKESERHNISGPWDEPTCWKKQLEQALTQRPHDGKITVFTCTALAKGDIAV